MTHTLRGSHLALVATLAVGLSFLPLWAQAGQNGSSSSNQTSSAAANPASTANPNQHAVTLMNTINRSEIATATAMADKAQSAKVRDFANMLKSDHKSAESDLQGIASSDRLTLEENHHMHARSAHFDNQLQKMSAYRADNLFVQHEAREHAQAIRMLRRVEDKVTDPNLRQYITDKYIPLLRKHEQKAHSLLAELGGPAASQPASKANPPHQHRPYDLPPFAQNGAQSGTGQNGANTTQKPASNPQAPGAPPAAANPSSQAGQPGQHKMPTTGSPLGLLILAGAGITGLGLGAKRRKK